MQKPNCPIGENVKKIFDATKRKMEYERGKQVETTLKRSAYRSTLLTIAHAILCMNISHFCTS